MRRQALPPDPVSPAREGFIALLVIYRELRAAGWPLLAAAACCAAYLQLAEPDPADGS